MAKLIERINDMYVQAEVWSIGDGRCEVSVHLADEAEICVSGKGCDETVHYTALLEQIAREHGMFIRTTLGIDTVFVVVASAHVPALLVAFEGRVQKKHASVV